MKSVLFCLCVCFFSSNLIIGCQPNPTFVLIHGAWHGNWTFYRLQHNLENAGYQTICINLPGHGLDWKNAGNVTLSDYQNAIVSVLDSVPEPVVLVGHSMGGIAISMAAEARPNKIDKLVYLAAFMPQNGQSMLELALMDTNSLIGPSLIIDSLNNTVDLERSNIAEIFYDESTAGYVYLSSMLLTPNPLIPLLTPVTLTQENYGSARSFYISTKCDKAITRKFQKYMYKQHSCEKIYRMNTGHSPFFSAPAKLKKILIKIALDDNPRGEDNSMDVPIEEVVSQPGLGHPLL